MIKFAPNHFFKFHGTGNDFILIFQNNVQNLCKRELAKKLCHRRFGVGADGLLLIRYQQCLYKMEVINSDGSSAKMCGNGLRCFAALLFKLNLVQKQFQLLTDDGKKHIQIKYCQKNQTHLKNKFLVSVQMGFGLDIKQIENSFLFLQNPQVYYTIVGVPHIILFLTEKQLAEVDLKNLSDKFQATYEANINFCTILNQNKIKVTTCERGAGFTYSCGTGVCSTAYVCYKKKNLKEKIQVQTEGGLLQILIGKNDQILMTGPAEQICQGEYFIQSKIL